MIITVANRWGNANQKHFYILVQTRKATAKGKREARVRTGKRSQGGGHWDGEGIAVERQDGSAAMESCTAVPRDRKSRTTPMKLQLRFQTHLQENRKQELEQTYMHWCS